MLSYLADKGNENGLRKLELVKANLNDLDVPDLKKIVQEAPFLAYLDLSWNEFT